MLSFRRFLCQHVVSLFALSIVCSLLINSAAGQQQSLRETSLSVVPADVAFYASLLNNRQQYQIFAESNAFKRLAELPIVQLAKLQVQGMLEYPPDPKLKAALQWLKEEENQGLKNLLKDAVSNEIFLYGGQEFGESIVLINRLNNVSNMAQLESLQTGESQEEIMSRRLLEILNENPETMRVPDVVIGFKLSEAESAERELDRLEELAKTQLEQWNKTDRLERLELADGDFLTLELRGSDLPWDELSDEQLENEQFAQLVARVKQMKIKVTLGIHGDYLLLSLGDSNDHLGRLGQDKTLLEQEEIQALPDVAGKLITNISYASADFLQTAASVDQQIADLNSMAKQVVEAAEVDEAIAEELRSDIDKAFETLKQFIPKPGATASVEYLTDRGYEGWTHDYSEYPYADSSQQLPILRHVGPKPILFVATRQKQSPEGYDFLVNLIERSVYYGEKLGLEQLDEQERETYQKVKQALQPLAKQWDEITRNKLAPAFQDGQSALVVEAEITSTQWHEEMPKAEVPLPILEVAIVVGVSDAELAEQAFEEYHRALGAALKRLRTAVPDTIPPVSLPVPEMPEVSGGKLFKYSLPENWGLDDQLALTAGLSEDFFVVTASPAQATRLLDEGSLEVSGGPLSKTDRKLASAAYFNFASLINAASPWVDYALAQTMGEQAGSEDDPSSVQAQVNTVLDVLQAWRGYASVSYLEEDVMVTHHEWHFEDLQ